MASVLLGHYAHTPVLFGDDFIIRVGEVTHFIQTSGPDEGCYAIEDMFLDEGLTVADSICRNFEVIDEMTHQRMEADDAAFGREGK
jgi:hypothetical protein